MTRRTSPEDGQRIAAHAQSLACQDCGAQAGDPCVQPGRGRSVHPTRYRGAAIALRRELRDAGRTAEQLAILAALPKIPRSEFAAITTERGGLRTTREWFESHSLPWPPIAGWREAVEEADE
jgi:hypothetical protein